MKRIRLCPVEDLPVGGSKIFPIGRHGIGVYNVDGRVVALENYCPHAGAPVCRGRVTGHAVVRAGDRFSLAWARAGEILRCPWHHWEFDLVSGETLTDPTRRVKTREIHIVDGWICVDA
jgi:nitrite reductase/ring-hydroxylating ferredoxin subunit